MTSTEELNQSSTTTYIPEESDIEVEGGGRSWRFAHGKIVRGQEIKEKAEVKGKMVEIETGDYPEERTSVLGLLRRIWIYEGTYKEKKVHQFEADIETRDGLLLLKSKLLNAQGEFKPSISALNFAWCCLQFAKDELIRLETALGEPATLPDGSEGGRPTYVNAYRIENNRAKPLYRPKRDKSAPKQTPAEQWAELEKELRKHPAWKERDIPIAEDTHLAHLNKECAEKGWPSPSQAPNEWLQLAAKAFPAEYAGGAPATLTIVPDDQWGEIRQLIGGLAEMPGLLTPAAERLKKEPAAAAGSGINTDAFK